LKERGEGVPHVKPKMVHKGPISRVWSVATGTIGGLARDARIGAMTTLREA
jgi:hypothetical protein